MSCLQSFFIVWILFNGIVYEDFLDVWIFGLAIKIFGVWDFLDAWNRGLSDMGMIFGLLDLFYVWSC